MIKYAMPSVKHTFLVDVFRNNPQLVETLLVEHLQQKVPAYTRVQVEEADLSELPPEYTADLVLVFYFGDKPAWAVVLEVQLCRDPSKEYSWPAYGAVERARRKCPTSVLVVTLTEEITRWASRRIYDAEGGISLKPLVLGPAAIPDLSQEEANEEPDLAMLAVLAHCDGPQLGPLAKQALAAVDHVAEDRKKLYYEVLFAILREASRTGLLEKQMVTQLIDRYKDMFQGFYEEGRQDGRLEGRQDGRLEERREMLQVIYEDRHGAMHQGLKEALQAIQDLARLKSLMPLFLHGSAEEIAKALECPRPS